MPTSDLLSVHDAARMLNTDHVGIIRLVRAGRLKGGWSDIQTGYRVPADSVREYLGRQA